MKKKATKSKPKTATRKKAKEGRRPSCCSRLVLQFRLHDRQQGWSGWETIEGRRLREKFGDTPHAWKRSCVGWIEMGGRYEYQILRVTETLEWAASFTENAAGEATSSEKGTEI